MCVGKKEGETRIQSAISQIRNFNPTKYIPISLSLLNLSISCRVNYMALITVHAKKTLIIDPKDV